MEIVIIGSGNVATAMGRKFLSAGDRIVQVYSRNPEHARRLAEKLQARPVSSVREIETKTGLVLIALADQAIPSFLREFPPAEAFLVHTAAAVPLHALKDRSSRYGVFYPLQSFTRNLDRLPEFPLLVDAGSEQDLEELKTIGRSLSKTVIHAGDELRLKYHLGAVILNNFSNHLFALTESWCRQEGLSFELLQPLLQETFVRLEFAPPGELQTGPAVRNDRETLEKHRLLLKPFPELSALYELFTRSIRPARAEEQP